MRVVGVDVGAEEVGLVRAERVTPLEPLEERGVGDGAATGALERSHLPGDQEQKSVAKTLAEAAGVCKAIAERVLEDMRVLAARSNVVDLEPEDRRHVDLRPVEVELVERIRAVVVELENWLTQDTRGDLQDADVAHDAGGTRLAFRVELGLAVDERAKRDRLVERQHRHLHTARELLVRARRVCDASWCVRLQLLGSGALRGTPNWQQAEGDNELVVVERWVLSVDDLEVAEAGEPSDVVFGVGEGVAKGKKVRADHDLQSEVGEEQSAVENLVAQALVRVLVAQSVEEGTCVEVRVDRRLEVERQEIAVRVLGPEVPHDVARLG